MPLAARDDDDMQVDSDSAESYSPSYPPSPDFPAQVQPVLEDPDQMALDQTFESSRPTGSPANENWPERYSDLQKENEEIRNEIEHWRERCEYLGKELEDEQQHFQEAQEEQKTLKRQHNADVEKILAEAEERQFEIVRLNDILKAAEQEKKARDERVQALNDQVASLIKNEGTQRDLQDTLRLQNEDQRQELERLRQESVVHANEIVRANALLNEYNEATAKIHHLEARAAEIEEALEEARNQCELLIATNAASVRKYEEEQLTSATLTRENLSLQVDLKKAQENISVMNERLRIQAIEGPHSPHSLATPTNFIETARAPQMDLERNDLSAELDEMGEDAENLSQTSHTPSFDEDVILNISPTKTEQEITPIPSNLASLLNLAGPTTSGQNLSRSSVKSVHDVAPVPAAKAPTSKSSETQTEKIQQKLSQQLVQTQLSYKPKKPAPGPKLTIYTNATQEVTPVLAPSSTPTPASKPEYSLSEIMGQVINPVTFTNADYYTNEGPASPALSLSGIIEQDVEPIPYKKTKDLPAVPLLSHPNFSWKQWNFWQVLMCCLIPTFFIVSYCLTLIREYEAFNKPTWAGDGGFQLGDPLDVLFAHILKGIWMPSGVANLPYHMENGAGMDRSMIF